MLFDAKNDNERALRWLSCETHHKRVKRRIVAVARVQARACEDATKAVTIHS
jgi:hypothetical protein